MSSGVDFDKRKVPTALDLSDLSAVAVLFQRRKVDFVESGLTGPFQSFGPGMVAKPVADEISVALDTVEVSWLLSHRSALLV